MTEGEDLVRTWQEITASIRPLLAGHSPIAQGAVLADLVAMFFAGHHPKRRAMLMEGWMSTVNGLMAVYGKENMPDGWPEQTVQ